jgi:hypothetical protein
MVSFFGIVKNSLNHSTAILFLAIFAFSVRDRDRPFDSPIASNPHLTASSDSVYTFSNPVRMFTGLPLAD